MEDRVLKIKDTTATKKIFSLTKRIRAVCGGTSASKTISILVWCIDYAQTVPNELISIVSESYPHLEKGAMTDFENIMKDRGYWKQDRWNKTKHTYTFEKGTKIEFYAVDTYGKAHGPRRDILFLNECNNLPWSIVDQLMVRTRKIVWMDWNPVNEFWFYTEIQNQRDDVDFLTLTYLDNEALDEITIQEIESHKSKKQWWLVYGLGQQGEVEGRIYRNWAQIDEIPPEARLERYGLDYGYSNDPTAIVAVYRWNGAFIWDEVTYQKRLSNKNIADIILNQDEEAIVVPDSAEPKSNDELIAYGLNVLPAQKGKGSVNHGIQVVQSQTIFVTKRSARIWTEYKNYLWEKDKKDGLIINTPQQGFDHAMDAGRYAMETLNIDVGLTDMDKYVLDQARRKSGTNYAK